MPAASRTASRRRLEVENLFLRHQLNIALREAPKRLRLWGSDRALLVWMSSQQQKNSGPWRHLNFAIDLLRAFVAVVETGKLHGSGRHRPALAVCR